MKKERWLNFIQFLSGNVVVIFRVPLPIRFWGSKLSGELVDESYCEIEEELKERLEEFLQFAGEE